MYDSIYVMDVSDQIARLKSRGMIIDDDKKAKEYLLDIGFYRLGFYWFPFEEAYPKKSDKTHKLKSGTRMEYAIRLYYFDFDIRNLFLRYISRIEINFRTKVIYKASNRFSGDLLWYVDPSNFKAGFVSSPKYQASLNELQKESVIAQDLKKHGSKYSPAYKAIEYMTFGTLIRIYENLKDAELKNDIAKEFGLDSSKDFSNYINTILKLRNQCAHGKVLFDMHLPQPIRDSKWLKPGERKTKLSGAYMVLNYMLGVVSANRRDDLTKEMKAIFSGIKLPEVRDVIENCSGLNDKLL